MGTELVVLGQTDIMKGGLGLNSKAFQMKPSTIELVQPTSRAEGAIPGKLRISDTGQHYDEMQVVMLFEPVEQRAYFEGQDFNKDSKLCFSLDNVAPHDKAKVPQAMTCANCPKASWEKYRQTKAREDLPKCKEYWHLVLADRVTKLPYYLNVRGTSIAPFIKAMGVVVKMIHLMKAQGQSPNVFDISFKIYPTKKPGEAYFTLGFKDIAPLAAEARPDFGAIFLDFANRKANAVSNEEEDATPVAENAINNAVVEQASAPVVLEGEIVI
jgi:hypothetical protein